MEMMKRTILLWMTGVLLLSGCESFLSEVPDDRTQIADLEAVKALLVSAYPEGHYMTMGEVMSDNVEDKGSYRVATMAQPIEEAYNWADVSSENQDSPGYYWSRCYSAIAAANHALEAIDEMGNTEELLPYRGEALLCRAYAHFMLVNFWGEHYNPSTAATELGVPYVTKPEKEALVTYRRNTVQEVYDLIEKDLLEGLPLIRDNAYDVAKYHFNREASYAFAARYYTYRGDSWDKVLEYSNKVLGEGSGFSAYLRNYPDKYRPLSSNPVEFAKLYTNYGEQGNLLITAASCYWGNTAGFSRYGMGDKKLYEILLNGAKIKSLGWMDNLIWGASPHFTVYKYTIFFKYLYPGSTVGYYYVFNPVFRAEEVMFNRMEAYVMTRDYDRIIADFNVYWKMRIANLTSADLITFDDIKSYYQVTLKGEWERLDPWYAGQLDEEQQIMLKYITDIRRKEFCQEGMRWFDVKRFYIPVVHNNYDTEGQIVLGKNDPRRRIQIPYTALSYGIEENPR